MNMQKKWKKISCPEHNNKVLAMIGEERALIQAGTNKGNGIKKETKEMERTWAAIFSSIFTLFHVMH